MSTERLEAHGFVMESPTSPLEEDLPPLESADAEIEAQLEGLPSSLRSADPTLALEELAELIDAAEGEWATALGLVSAMVRANVEATTITYSAAISACEKGGEWVRSLGLLSACLLYTSPSPRDS